MRIVFIDDTKLLINNHCTSQAQEIWAASVLLLGIIGIYVLVSKVAENILLLWIGMLLHLSAFLFTCWYFAPVITTFVQPDNTVIIEKQCLWITLVSKYSLLELQAARYLKTRKVVCLVLSSGKSLYLSNAWNTYRNCQEVLEIIQNKFIVNNKY